MAVSPPKGASRLFSMPRRNLKDGGEANTTGYQGSLSGDKIYGGEGGGSI